MRARVMAVGAAASIASGSREFTGGVGGPLFDSDRIHSFTSASPAS